MSSHISDNFEPPENAHFLVIMIGSLEKRVAHTLKRQLSDASDNELGLVAIHSASDTLTESDSHTTLYLDSKRLQSNEQGVPSAAGLAYLHDVIGQRFQNYDAIFMVADFRDKNNPALAAGLGYLLSTKTLSSQAFVLAIVAEPGGFELPQWHLVCQQGRRLLRQHCDTVVINSTKKILNLLSEDQRPLSDYFEQEADAIANVITLFTDYLWHPSMIGIDFSDIYMPLLDMGESTFASGQASGENAAKHAAEQALSRLQRDWANSGHTDIGSVLANLSGSDFLLAEFDEVGSMICAFFNASVCVKIGASITPELAEGERRVKIMAITNKTLGA